MFEQHIDTVKRLADWAKQFDFVEAIAISGSIQSGFGTEASDADTYVYITREITMDERNQIVSNHAKDREIIDFWGASDYFIDSQTGVEVDFMYFRTDFMQEQVERVLIRHQAQMGYSTAFWHTVRQSLVIYDRDNWFTELHTLSQRPYPDELAKNIINLNLPLLADIPTAYRAQIKKAIERNDLISLNHRITAFLASYFDILFAINRQAHPGEKRLLQFVERCAKQPKNLADDLNQLIQSIGTNNEDCLIAVDKLVDNLKTLLVEENLI